MRNWILPFEDIGRTDVSVAGGKGANLGELVGKGFPVPPGFVVSAKACQSFFRDIDLQQEVAELSDSHPETWGDRCETVQRKIHAANMDVALSGAILSAHADLMAGRSPETLCAVRSSATAEDLGDASFAGQHATYYYVDGTRLLHMIKHCWSSLFHPEAVSYRSTQGIDHAAVWMAVIVQEMIPAEISGVTFTADPVTGSRDQVVTESSWGMGAAIVDGRVTPDHYVSQRSNFKIHEKRIADKQFLVPSRLTVGSETRLEPVSHDMRHRETLSDALLKVVSQWAVRAEAHFGCPQDVEWAIVKNEYFMLQARPITVMGREEIHAEVKGPHVIFKPLLENFTDPVTPLTADCYQFLFSPPMMKMIKGWLYVNLKVFRTVFPFRISDQSLASFLYDFGTDSPRLKISFLQLPRLMVLTFFGYLMFGVFFSRTRNLPAEFMNAYRQLVQQVDADPDCQVVQTQHRLLWWSRFLDPAGYQVMFVNLSSLRYFISLGLLDKLLVKWFPNLREGAASLLCSGTKKVLSAEMGRGIWDLAKLVMQEPRLKILFETAKPRDMLDAIKTEPEAAGFLTQLQRFLAKNGHRGLKELELQSLRWEENPAPLLGMIRNYLLAASDPEAHERRVAQTRSDLEKDIQMRLATFPGERFFHFRWRLIRHLVKVTQYYARLRENSRFYHTLGFYAVRKKILQLEKAFIGERKLRCRGDIFYLKLVEVLQLSRGSLGWSDVEDRIRERRMQHVRLCKADPPKTINIKKVPPTLYGERSEEIHGDTYSGQPASPGSYEGMARVILDPSTDVELKPGEVLVAPYTDPAWTPLFLTAGAAIVEIGSYLSHAGTVAREFGMPCVVDLPGCTRRIQTGCRVHVDGDRGVVTLVEQVAIGSGDK